MPTDIDEDRMEEIQNSDEVWVIDFWAEWCKPCEKYGPIFEEVSEKVDGVNFGKVDMEEHSQLGQNLGVRALPTTLILKGGEEVDRNAGVMQADELEDWIEDKV
ncbi:MAG: thioredoxin [Candidatus Nanohaloarchaea archaeon]